jgi:hypothetical protein
MRRWRQVLLWWRRVLQWTPRWSSAWSISLIGGWQDCGLAAAQDRLRLSLLMLNAGCRTTSAFPSPLHARGRQQTGLTFSTLSR